MSPRFCCAFLCLVCSSPVLGQSGALARVSAPVTARQGEAVVAATRIRERQGSPSPDCSHLVQEIYSIAGLPYPYTDSFDLYVGIKNFVRVSKPQPGDLIVWRGHVGIVIDPTEHSFYSALNSGLGTDFYDAPYWKARGPARFYRYVRAAAPTISLARHGTQTTAQPVKINSSHSERSLESPTISSEPAEPDTTREYDSPAIDTDVEIPSSILVPTAHRIPSPQELGAALSELNNASASILRGHDLAELSRKVIIYEELAVQRVDVKGQQGSAQIRIDSRVAVMTQGIERRPSHQVIRWKIIRTIHGWEVLAQPDCVYVPRDLAIHELATHLVLLTQKAGASQTKADLSEQAEIVRVLSALMPTM